VTFYTPINTGNSNNANLLVKKLNGAFEIDNVNYVSKNVDGEIGINLINPQNEEIKPFSLQNYDGNGMRKYFGVYDKMNLDDDLDKFDLKSSITHNGLDSYFSSLKSITGTKNFDMIEINLADSIPQTDIIKKVTSKIKSNPNNAIINIAVIDVEKQIPVENLKTIESESNITEVKKENEEASRKENIDFKSKFSNETLEAFRKNISLSIDVDINKKTVIWGKSFGLDFPYKIEFIDYVSGSVVCSKNGYTMNSLTATYILQEFSCIKPNNRYILKVTTQANITGYNEISDCCSIGFQSGHFSEDCECDNTCN
jgi:hypothetical protein